MMKEKGWPKTQPDRKTGTHSHNDFQSQPHESPTPMNSNINFLLGQPQPGHRYRKLAPEHKCHDSPPHQGTSLELYPRKAKRHIQIAQAQHRAPAPTAACRPHLTADLVGKATALHNAGSPDPTPRWDQLATKHSPAGGTHPMPMAPNATVNGVALKSWMTKFDVKEHNWPQPKTTSLKLSEN
ncbi:hypothetical protein XENOCAPTIV_018893 [Xenoophorus captivus]|uniref:Uncharacterized protein n=1 Tax=Xenoophorus captivus TaxID=1517983 RepID=A0ABV0QJ18_9TELE